MRTVAAFLNAITLFAFPLSPLLAVRFRNGCAVEIFLRMVIPFINDDILKLMKYFWTENKMYCVIMTCRCVWS